MRVLEIYENGKPRSFEGDEHATPPPDGVVRWIDIERPGRAELMLLAQRFGFHPLAIEDCAHFDQRPKVEEYEDHAMIDAFFPVVDRLTGRIEELEEALLNRGSNRGTLEEILRLKRLLVSLRRVLPAQRDVLAQLAKRVRGHISDRTSLYFRDAYDHLLRIHESVEANRELLGNLPDAYHWTVSQRTNEIEKRLTIVSAVFLPLTFITGSLGQNFKALPFESTQVMLAMLLSCVVVPAGRLFFFLRSRWF